MKQDIGNINAWNGNLIFIKKSYNMFCDLVQSMFVCINCNFWVVFVVFFLEELWDVGCQFGMPVITDPYKELKIDVPSYGSHAHLSGPMCGLLSSLFTVLVWTKH
jgi:hypothetical protein